MRDFAQTLITAIKENNLARVSLLLARGADPNSYDRFRQRGHLPYRSPALQVALFRVDDAGLGQQSLENTDLLRALLNAGADVNRRDTSGFTPLRLAVLSGKRESVRLLLDAGADIDLQDRQGQTPLMVAVGSYGDKAGILRDLLARGAEVDQRTTWGATALMFAANRPHLELLRLLLEAGANPTLKDDFGRTALNLLDGRMAFPDVPAAVALLRQAV